jgi:hypothetical protein
VRTSERDLHGAVCLISKALSCYEKLTGLCGGQISNIQGDCKARLFCKNRTTCFQAGLCGEELREDV